MPEVAAPERHLCSIGGRRENGEEGYVSLTITNDTDQVMRATTADTKTKTAADL